MPGRLHCFYLGEQQCRPRLHRLEQGFGSFKLQGVAPAAPCWHSQHGSMPSTCLQQHSSLSPLVRGVRGAKLAQVGAVALMSRAGSQGHPFGHCWLCQELSRAPPLLEHHQGGTALAMVLKLCQILHPLLPCITGTICHPPRATALAFPAFHQTGTSSHVFYTKRGLLSGVLHQRGLSSQAAVPQPGRRQSPSRCSGFVGF